MPNPPITSNATLHALTERLASHSRSLHPLIGSNFASSFSPQAVAAAASAYRQPAPPPQLPVLQLVGRHQDVLQQSLVNGQANGDAGRCPAGKIWPESGVHEDIRCSRCEEEELEGFIEDMGRVLRREFDCWVEQCWTQAFHHLFTHTVPNLLIHLILTGASPTFLRRRVVHGGLALDHLFQVQMLDLLCVELELRLSGARPSEASSSKPPPNPAQPNLPPVLPRDGICFHSLACQHGQSTVPEDDDHGLCLCQLTTCLGCFREAAKGRKGPVGPLPFDLIGTSVAIGWTGLVETEAQARVRRDGMRPATAELSALPEGKGFIQNSKATANGHSHPKPPQIFPHPQMTDVLAVEEHLRWRLKEMGASDPAVESRYGPFTNSPAALDGIELPEDSEDGSVKGGNGNVKGGKMVKVTRGKGKVRRLVNGNGNGNAHANANGKKDGKDKGRICYLPKEWAEEEPGVRNTAIVLTFRHFVKLLHQAATAASPFLYPSYFNDVDEVERVHPIALYRRLAEPSVTRRKNGRETRNWQECMDKWAEELGAREKTQVDSLTLPAVHPDNNQGNLMVNEQRHLEAVEYYTRAISLDPKKTVYYSNRAVALNTLGLHDRAEADCKHILSKDSKNGKAFYQRALARRGMERWREAETDLREVLKFQPGNETAKKMLGVVRGEVVKMPKQKVEDVMDF